MFVFVFVWILIMFYTLQELREENELALHWNTLIVIVSQGDVSLPGLVKSTLLSFNNSHIRSQI